MARLVLGLGSNLGNSGRVFSDCLTALSGHGLILKTSRLWQTRPVGPRQPDFLNAAVLIDWPSAPRLLLHRCRELESKAGRDRSTELHWGPRPLDLDLLMAEGIVCRGPSLELPHPRLHERRFALEPAAEVAPDWVHLLLGMTVEELARRARSREPDAVLATLEFESKNRA